MTTDFDPLLSGSPLLGHCCIGATTVRTSAEFVEEYETVSGGESTIEIC